MAAPTICCGLCIDLASPKLDIDSVHVLVFNSGSSSIKTELIDTGTGAAIEHTPTTRIDAVAHRIVHGGADFVKPARIDDMVYAKLEQLESLAPLHNAKALEGVRKARGDYPALAHIAVFDTAFHHDLPDASKTYAIDTEVAERYGIRRYGFHGISYASLASRFPEGRVIALHLGSGASACAIKDGQSVATSMGFTPTAGLVMGTRSGDIDPGVLDFLGRNGWNVDDIDGLLNRDSGLKGLAGHSDMRELLTSKAPEARRALDVFCTRVIEYVGAYMARLQGVDTIVFTAGIGENTPPVRARIIDSFAWCGITLDEDANNQTLGRDAKISSTTSAAEIWVIAAREAVQMAREVESVLANA